MSTDPVNKEGLSIDSIQMKDSNDSPKRRLPPCPWITMLLAGLLFIMGVTMLSIMWPHEMGPLVQSATCSVSPEHLKQTAVNLNCYYHFIPFLNQTEQKSCKEAEQAMVLECQQGLQGFDDKCPFPSRNKTTCAKIEGKRYYLFELECHTNTSLKANVTLKDGPKFEQLELVLPLIGSNQKLNFNISETFDCYYTVRSPRAVYSDEMAAKDIAEFTNRIGRGLGIIFGWVPFAISIVLLLALGIYYRTRKIE
jgi:hypothetical protein